MKKIVIAGGTGYLGTCLIQHFTQLNYQIIVLSRKHHVNTKNVFYVKWDAKSIGSWKEELECAEAIINLTGKSVDCRYTEKNKQLIYDSRLNATNILGKAIQQLQNPPKVWINSASATIYRHSLDKEMDETTGEYGEGFSVDVCKKWEQSFNQFELTPTRKVLLRIAIVMGKNGGAFQPLSRLAKLGLGGKQGSGKQYVSWLHEVDFCKIIDFSINNTAIEGTYNAAAPNPVTNKTMMKQLREAYKMPFGIPTPKFLLKIGAFFIRTEPELVLKSRRVVPKKLLDINFQFQYNELEAAFSDIVLSSD